MSSILIQSDLRRSEERKALGSMLKGLDGESVGNAQASLEQDVGVCPYAVDERCEGVKDSEAREKCLASDFSYAGCSLFYKISKNDRHS